MEYFSGVRFENFIIYSKDLNDDNLEFLQNYKEQLFLFSKVDSIDTCSLIVMRDISN